MSLTNRFQEELYLNKGGYAEVYRVKRHGQYYALKKIYPYLLNNPMYMENVERQISIMSNIDHPNIIKFYETIRDEQEISLLLEYAEGGSLYDQLKIHQRLSEKQVKGYVKNIIQALQYLHQRPNPILHRDIKPQNLLIGQNGVCKLADFGSANILDGQRYSYVGTKEYMAPQMIDNQPHGVLIDIWCLGVLIYELLTGQIPGEQAVIYPSFLTRSAEDVIKRLLIKNPNERMTLAQLKQHIWLFEAASNQCHITKNNALVIFNKTANMKQKLQDRLKQQKEGQSKKKLTNQTNQFKKQKSFIGEAQELNSKADEFIQLLKYRQKLKFQIRMSEEILERQQKRRSRQRSYLLQQIQWTKNKIKNYERDINILKNYPLKFTQSCKKNILSIQQSFQRLDNYIKVEVPNRIKSDILGFSTFEEVPEILTFNENLYRLRTQLLVIHRDALIELFTTTKSHQDTIQIINMQLNIQSKDYKQQKKGASECEEQCSLRSLNITSNQSFL